MNKQESKKLETVASYEGDDSRGIRLVAGVADESGGEYREAYISVYQGEGESATLVADVLVGLSPSGEVRVLVSTGGNGDEHALAIYPERRTDTAVEPFND